MYIERATIICASFHSPHLLPPPDNDIRLIGQKVLNDRMEFLNLGGGTDMAVVNAESKLLAIRSVAAAGTHPKTRRS